mmetsp:Transcript_25050/g.59535  ORF Transcript_25050/g.59535 Transcript_25050/m.59535 type:complete len:530 (+) Transcript_25050:182-1771(+)
MVPYMTISQKQEAATMFFTKRSKKVNGNGEEAASAALKKSGVGNGNKGNKNGNNAGTGGSRVLLSWRPGSTNSSMLMGQNSNKSSTRTESQNSLKSQPMVVPDVELQPTDTGDSNELIEVVPVPADTGPIADQLQELQSGGDRDSLDTQPFQDHHHHDDDYQDDDEDGVSIPRETQQEVLQTSADPKPPSTPTQPQVRKPDRCDNGRTKSPFVPPEEINIDFQPQPLSPIRDLTVPQQRSSFREPSPSHDLLSEDIVSMKRQLLDSQRLVRLILGKPLSHVSNRDEIDASLLDTNTVLQAIKAFALMKQELGELRKRQEQDDNDPPAILQTLSSPTTTSREGGGSSFSTPSSRLTPTQAESASKEMNDDMVARDSPFDMASPTMQPSNSVIALWDANKRIKSLQEELETARNTIPQSLQDGERQESKQQQQQQEKVQPGTDQDKEINLLRSLLQQSQNEADVLRHKLNRMSSTSLSDPLLVVKEEDEEEDAENEKPKLDIEGLTKFVSGNQLSLSLQGPTCEEEKKVDM